MIGDRSVRHVLPFFYCCLLTCVLFPFQDEQSSVAMLKKHQILEQAVEDYAETVHQLSKTSRGLVADNHPERYDRVQHSSLPHPDSSEHFNTRYLTHRAK